VNARRQAMASEGSVPPTLGAILAGGLARRLGGGDKALRTVGGRTVLARIVERVSPQVRSLIINANDDPARFDEFGLPVVADSLPDHPGPLAGVLAALEWAIRSDPGMVWVLTVPGDAPFLPRDLVSRMHTERERRGAAFACAASKGRSHPVVALWPVSVRDELRQAVAYDGVRRLDAFTKGRVAEVEWSAIPADPFFNLNAPDDLMEANCLARAHPDL
jgi:molybdopterin-guanine dinucleotide biosynthesis protein A